MREEFLNCHGTYVLDAEFSRNKQPALLWQMIQYELQTFEQDAFATLDDDEQFAELIESEDWFLLNDTGVKTAIIAPIFNRKTEITWRYNADKNA